MHELTCDEVQDAAPQFALDILEPSARAEVAAHLIRCPGCRHEVSGMQESAAQLLDLRDHAPLERATNEPLYLNDDGYRTFRALYPDDESDGPVPARRRRLRMVVTLTAVAALFIGTALGPELSRPAASRTVPLASAQLVQADRAVGTVNFYTRHVPAVELAVRGLTAKGRLTCVLVAIDGTTIALGSFKLYEGSGYWGNSKPVDPSRVAAFDLVDSAGRLVASASMS